jgi:hypothetical protein
MPLTPLPLLLALAAPAAAAPSALGPQAYAVVVGSHRPGPGQAPLRWAGEDAARVADVFVDLGGMDPARVDVLEDPGVAALLSALDDAAARMEADRAAGGEPSFLFYYSGHARAAGLDLGGEQLALDDLRDELDAMPARIRLVVLDACQAGAVSGVKGVAPAAAFSSASIRGLEAEGTAIIASSTGSELSQESDALQGSYFTHHLVTGLRGAADGDSDGVVTLDEAYAYAYDRTLTSTAETAVGRQHATLETDLRGRGGVALTRPEGARARLRFGPEQDGEVLLADADTGVVRAEISKARGDAVTLALPPGDYTVWWEQRDRTRRCRLALEEGRTADFAPRACSVVRAPATAKGGTEDPALETWGFELGVGGLQVAESDYTARLQDFSFEPGTEWFGNPTAHLALSWSPLRNLAVVGTWGSLDSARWSRETVGYGDEEERATDFAWTARRLGVSARGQLPIAKGWLVPYLQAGGGLAWAATRYQDPTLEIDDDERFVGWHLAAAGGVQLMPMSKRGWRHLGVFGQLEASTAPVVENLLGERHDAGGLATTFGIRGAF